MAIFFINQRKAIAIFPLKKIFDLNILNIFFFSFIFIFFIVQKNKYILIFGNILIMLAYVNIIYTLINNAGPNALYGVEYIYISIFSVFSILNIMQFYVNYKNS